MTLAIEDKNKTKRHGQLPQWEWSSNIKVFLVIYFISHAIFYLFKFLFAISFLFLLNCFQIHTVETCSQLTLSKFLICKSVSISFYFICFINLLDFMLYKAEWIARHQAKIVLCFNTILATTFVFYR